MDREGSVLKCQNAVTVTVVLLCTVQSYA